MNIQSSRCRRRRM